MLKRPHPWVPLAVVTVSVGVLIGWVAPGGRSSRDVTGLGHRLDGRFQLPLGRESLVGGPEPGSVLTGGETVAHFEGARRARRHRGANGRTIYTGTTAGEPTLGIDNKGNVFFQGIAYEGVAKPIVVVSRDGGGSWDEVTPQTHAHTFDPMLYVDVRTGRAFTADLSGFECTTVSHTDDVGESWTTSEACGLSDHQNVFAGPPVTSPTVGYPNVVYMCAIDGGSLSFASAATSCLKSLDGGLTWVRTGAPAYTSDPRQGPGTFDIPGNCGGGSGHGVVDSKGTVYLPRGWCNQPYLAISKDEGATWERIQVAGNGMPRTEDVLAMFDHEAAVAVDAKGNIYYFWTATDRLPYLAVSRDGGESFSKPMMVGPPGLKEAWGPTIAVGDVGKVALAYVGSTNAPGGRSPDGLGEEYDDLVTWNGYITTSVDALSKKPRFFTTSVNPVSDPIIRRECGVVTCGVEVDFIDVVIGPDGKPWISMVDGCPPPGKRCDMDRGVGFVGTVIGGPKLR